MRTTAPLTACCGLRARYLPEMFIVSEADAAAIRAIYEQKGELSAALEVRRRFPGITDNGHARACARQIAGWKLLPKAPGVPPCPRPDRRR